MNRQQRREHLVAVITSARLRNEPADAIYARSALNLDCSIGYRVMSLRCSLIMETPAGDNDRGDEVSELRRKYERLNNP